MAKESKQRQALPNCEGRFGELRSKCYAVARKIRQDSYDPEKTLTNFSELRDFVQRVASPTMENEEYTDDELVAQLATFDALKPNDPYFNSTRDKLRGDPINEYSKNVTLALVPFVYEGMRETLYEFKSQASSLQQSVNRLGRPGENIDADQLLMDIFLLTGKEFTLDKPQDRFNASIALQHIIDRDFTITQNAMYPGLLDEFAALYVTDIGTVDRLRYFHRGERNLDQKLGIDMGRLSVPGKKSGNCTLQGYSLWAEFGTGPNLTRNQVGSAPYRLELRKVKPDNPDLNQAGSQVFGMSFYLKAPNTMVIYQIQDIRGSKVPECTTDGLAALTIAERVGRELGFRKVEAYSHFTNPLRLHYRDDAEVANALKMNFDEPAKKLKWHKHPDNVQSPNDGIEYFSKTL